MAISTLLVVALVHVIYLLHENRWIKVVHGASLAIFSLPFLAWAMATVSPELPLVGVIRGGPGSVELVWYANIVLLAALSVWSVIAFTRQSGAGGARPVQRALRGAAELSRRRALPDAVHRGVSLVRTVGHGFQPDLPGFRRGVFQAPDRSLHRRRQHPVDRRRDRVFDHRRAGLCICRKRAPVFPAAARRGGYSDAAAALGADRADARGRFRNLRLFLRTGAFFGRGEFGTATGAGGLSIACCTGSSCFVASAFITRPRCSRGSFSQVPTTRPSISRRARAGSASCWGWSVPAAPSCITCWA